MVQNTLVIDNQAANPARLDIQEAIQAVATNSSDATASPTASTPPTTTYPNMWWYDTYTQILYIRNKANNAWLNVAYLNQSGNFEVLDDTRVVNTSGTQTGLLGDQASSTWTTGTGTTESLVSPAKIKAAIDINAQSFALGAVGTTAFLGWTTANYTKGQDVAGSALYYAIVTRSAGNNITIDSGGVASGTWRLMGHGTGGFNVNRVSVWLRIS